MKNFNVSFQYSENVYCSNIAIAECREDVEKHYSNYAWVKVSDASEYDLEEAKAKGKPIITIEHQEPTENATEATETAEKNTSYIITNNEQFKSLEVSFNEKPGEEVRNALKGLGFRWHKMRGLWYGYKDAETVKRVLESIATDEVIAEGKRTIEKAYKAAKEKVNYYGVKVGDMFSASWGYEQTNVDFFQVIALVGDKSVRVREVYPKMIAESPTCSMAADRTYQIDRSQLLPPASHSVFIKDQEKGDLKRLKSYNKDGKSNPQFTLSSFADAYYISGDTVTEYESWYY